ncbi:MAG TPA: phage major capsid protein [Streptosporangiaceae bacterium]
MTTRLQDLMDKSLNCIHLARAIKDRYEDPTKMPADELDNMKALNKEAMRLRQLAEAEREHNELEQWSASPNGSHPALQEKASRDAAVAQATNGTPQGMSKDMATRWATAAFAKALRGGKDALTLEEKAAIIEDTTGQIIVPHDLAGPIFLQLPRLGVLRNLAFVRPTTSNLVDVRALTQATAGWGKIELSLNATSFDAGMAATGPNTVTVQNLNALALLGVDELQDTDANLVALVSEIIGQQFAQAEDDTFANGNGTSRPFGIATRATVGGAIPASQGVTAANAGSVSADEVKKLQYVILSRFANVGSYLASDDATQAIALLKDTTGNYLWQPSNQAGQPDTLFGRPFYRVSGLPSMATGAGASDPAVLFGDVRSGYLIADRQQITVQRLDERYADQGLVGFLFRQRVGGDVIRPAAFAKYLL